MPVTLDMFEYPNALLAQEAYPSSDAPWNILDEDCADFGGWIDGDGNGGESTISPAGQWRMDAKAFAPGNAYARRSRDDIASPPNKFTLRIRTYFDDLGLSTSNDYAKIEYQTATWRFHARFASDGLFITKAGGVRTEVGTDIVKEGGSAAWQIWDFVVDKSGGEAAATVEVFLDGVSQGTVDCDWEAASVDGRVRYTQRGFATDNMVSHIDYIKIGTHNLQCYAEPTIKEQGSYSLKVVALAANSLNDTLTRVVSPAVNLSDLTKTKFGIYASRTGSNIKIRVRDSGGTWSEYSVAISSANTWEAKEWDISGVPNVNKDVIDRIQIKITNADAVNVIYIDNMFANWWAKIFTEQMVLSDTFSRTWSLYRTFNEAITLTDTIIAFRQFYRVFTETLHLSDTLRKKIGKVFTENINLSDVFSRRWTIYCTFTETINLADTISLIRQFHRVFTETLHLTDTFSRVWHIYRTFTEKITLTDKVKVAKVNLVNLIKKLIHLEDIED